MKQLDVFIEGELIDLCIPTLEFAQKSEWYSWFNNPQLTRYLDQGHFPNDPRKQEEFYLSEKDKRLLLIVSNKQDYIGVISLNEIDKIKRSATMAMVLDNTRYRRMLGYISMEAIARVTEHALSTMGIDRIKSGQHIDLAGWQQRKELLGYRLEGITRNTFVKGREVADVMVSSITYEDYLTLVEKRGRYWDGIDQMRQRVKKLPKSRFIDRYKEFMEEVGNDYYDKVFDL